MATSKSVRKLIDGLRHLSIIDRHSQAGRALAAVLSGISFAGVVQSRFLVKPIGKYIDTADSRDEGICRAYRSGGYTMKAISDDLGLHYSTVSKIIKAFENSRFKT